MLTARIIFTVLISLVWTICAYAIDVKLRWEPNPESDIAGYKVYYGVNGLSNPTQLDVSKQTIATTISGLDPALNYSFAIAAYNTSGLEAPYSNIVTTLESVVPTVSITSPANNAQIINTVSISANASDNVAVTKVEYYVDSVLKSTDTAVPYQYAWDTSAITTGTHTITAKAYDAAGNIGTSSISVVVTKDVTPPVIASTAPAAGSVVSGIVSVSSTVSDNVGVSMVEFYANGAIQAAVNSTPYNYNWDTKTVSDGSYILTAKAYDAAGNVTTTSAVTVTVKNTASDTTAPLVSAFTLPTTATSLSVTVSSFTASDAIGVTGYLITKSATKPAASSVGWTATAPRSFTFSAAGSNTAYAWAKDSAGNVSASRSAVVLITLPAAAVNTLTINDALTALQVVVGIVPPTNDKRAKLDVAPHINGASQPDGIIDISDVIVILGNVTGKIVL